MGSVQLPTVAVCSQQTGLQADLRTSLGFCNHSSDRIAISSKDDILRLRKDEKLWIVPAAGCRLRISLRLLGRVSGQSLDMNEVARWVERCDIWERLKLRLRYCDTPSVSALEFSLQHPDLSASLICPPTAAKIELQDVRCQITITSSPGPRPGNKRNRDDLNDSGDEALPKLRSERSVTAALNSQDRSAVHDFVRGLTRTPDFAPGKYLENILQAAITVLVTGSVKHFTGVRVRQASTAHALVKLFPAVFHVPHVKNISNRAQHMPIIVSALAAMQHTAQSPALKRKVERLVDRGGFEKHLWCSTLSQIKQPSVPGPKMVVVRQHGQEVMEDTVTGHGLGSKLVCFGEDLFFSDLQGGINGSVETSSIDEIPPTVQIYDTLGDVLPSAEAFAEAGVIGRGGAHFSGGAEDMIQLSSDFFKPEQILLLKGGSSNCI